MIEMHIKKKKKVETVKKFFSLEISSEKSNLFSFSFFEILLLQARLSRIG